MAKNKKNKTKGDKPTKAQVESVYGDEIKRLNRVVGQVEGIAKMLGENRKLDAILMQCKAVHSALKSVESRLLKIHLEEMLEELAKIEKKKDRAERLSDLEDLFKQAA